MKLNRKQFLAALTILTAIPGKIMAITNKNHALPKLRITNCEPMRVGPWLADWRQCPRVPVFDAVHPTAQRLILASLRHELLTLRYWGGSTPGVVRMVSPHLIFQPGGYGPLFMSGYCHLRQQERVFRVSLVELVPDDSGIVCIVE